MDFINDNENKLIQTEYETRALKTGLLGNTGEFAKNDREIDANNKEQLERIQYGLEAVYLTITKILVIIQ